MTERAALGVVGAGLDGLSLALAARFSGIGTVYVYDTGAVARGTERIVDLPPNATRVLHAVGLRQPLHEIAIEPEAVHVRGWRSGHLLAQRPLGGFAEARYGAPHIRVDHQAFCTLLRSAAADAGVSLVETGPLQSIDQTNDGVWLEFDGAERREHAAVAGCDGHDSAVATAISGSRQAADASGRAYLTTQGVVPAERLPRALTHNIVSEWRGPGGFVRHGPATDGRVHFTAVWRGPDDDLAQVFDHWHPALAQLLADREAVVPVAARPPLEAWSDRRITLTGDACHPVLPFLDVGPALAIEDAWVLARMLERWEDETSAGIVDYERYRAPRCAKVQRTAATDGDEFLIDEGWARRKRDLALSLASRYLPEIVMAKRDWLYGYDCVRGFS